MIRRVEVIKPEYRKRIARDPTVGLSPGLNVLAGPNGSGKSTFLKALILPDGEQQEVSWLDVDAGTRFHFFDTESMNPRTLSHIHEKAGVYQIGSKFRSHGEALRPIVSSFGHVKRGEILIIDEPESGQDFYGQLQVADALRTKAKTNQVIVASHSVIVWAAASHIVWFGDDDYKARVVDHMKRALQTVEEFRSSKK